MLINPKNHPEIKKSKFEYVDFFMIFFKILFGIFWSEFSPKICLPNFFSSESVQIFS